MSLNFDEAMLTPERLLEIHNAYDAWVAGRKFDTSFDSFVGELVLRKKAEAYDRLVAAGFGPNEATDSPRPTDNHRAVTVLGMLGLLRWRWVSAGLAAGCLGVNAALTGTSWLGGVPFAHQLAVLSANAVPFFIGVGLAQGDLAVVGGWIVAIALALSTMAALGTPAFTPLLLVTLPLAVILLARSGSCDLGRVGDLSYGTYLWAFPVQQTIVHFLPGMAPLPLFALAGTATILLAALSWHLIEKRALALKPRRPATSQDAAPLPGG